MAKQLNIGAARSNRAALKLPGKVKGWVHDEVQIDPGSKYYLDMSGMYSRPGTTMFLTGAHLPGRWDHYRIH